MNWDRELIKILRDRLAFLIPGERDVQSSIEYAELDPAYIDLSGAPVSRWDKVLTEAKKHHKIDSIFKLAIERYPRDEILAKISRGEYSRTNENDAIDSRGKVPISKNAEEDLARILQKIDFRIVKNACIRSLHRHARHHALSIERIDEVFKLLLEEFQKRKDGKYRILEFAWWLCEDDEIQGEEIHWLLEDWSKQYGYEFESPLVEHTNGKNTPQPRLFIQVVPKHSEVNQFCVQAWLIPHRGWLTSDSDAKLFKKKSTQKEYFCLKEFFYLLSKCSQEIHKYISPGLLTKIDSISPSKSLQDTNKDREIKDIRHLSFAKDELNELWGLFLTESQLILYYDEEQVTEENDLSEILTIEVFLPSELLCDLDLGRWSFYNIFKGELEAVASSYRILIRSLERSQWLLSTDHRTQNKKKAWKKKWNSVRDKYQEGGIPTDLEFPLLKDTNSFDPAILDEKIGVKLVQESGTGEILKVIIMDKGISIALWTRFSDSEVDFESEWQELVHTTPLLDLPESVRILRKDAQESGCPNHLGSNLVLLWDDPNSLFPSIGDSLKLDNSKKRSES